MNMRFSANMEGTPSRRMLFGGATAVALTLQLASGAFAQNTTLIGELKATNGTEHVDGTMGTAAAEAMNTGALPSGAADIKAKATANKAFARERIPKGDTAAAELGSTMRVTSKIGFSGQFDTGSTPPDTTGAIGPNRYVQTTNRRFAIYTLKGVPLASGTLNDFQSTPGYNSFDPQVIYDPTTKKFYYVADAVASSTDNRIAYQFSKTKSPDNASDWCKYTLGSYGVEFPDFPKMGDSKKFIHTGVNVYNPSFIRSDIIHFSKPSTKKITGPCPSVSAWITSDLRDSTNTRVFAPTPANSIDTNASTSAFARNLSLPSANLWFFDINNSGGSPAVGAAKQLILPSSNSIPPDATQAGATQVLDTSDTRPTQAILARNPARADGWSFWTQQTVANAGTSAIRWYEVDPFQATPFLRASGYVAASGTFLYNAAISPDRQYQTNAKNGKGDKFVVSYSVSGATTGIAPRVVAGSASTGGPVGSFALLKDAVGPYRDFSCPNPGDQCRWGDYSSATPWTKVASGSKGTVWITNQYSGAAAPTTARTWIQKVKP